MDAAGAAAGTAAAAAADAIVDALAALVHASANNGNAANVADHFPLAQMLTAKLTDPSDHGVDGDTSLIEVWGCVGLVGGSYVGNDWGFLLETGLCVSLSDADWCAWDCRTCTHTA